MGDFETMDGIVKKFFAATPKPYLAFCDYIASTISKELKAIDSEKLLASVARPQLDLTESGSFRSTKKTIEVEDRYGKKYRITVEEA